LKPARTPEEEMPFHPTIASDSGRLLPRTRRRRLTKVAGKLAGNRRVEAQGDVEQIAEDTKRTAMQNEVRKSR
jgi:hypothetical protein